MHEYICVGVLKNRLIRLDQCLQQTPPSTERVNEYFAGNPTLNLENRSPPLPRQPRLEQLAPSRFRYAAGVANFAWTSRLGGGQISSNSAAGSGVDGFRSLMGQGRK